MSIKPVKKAVFPVGGLGTRFLPATKSMPKEMLTVVDKPLVHYVFEEARDAGIEQFIFITGRNKNTISNHFDHSYELQSILSEKNKITELELTKNWMPDAGNVIFIRQKEPLGLGHAVWCARHVIGDEPFAVMLPDDLILSDVPCLKQLMDVHQTVGGNVVGVADVPLDKVNSYGILDVVSDDGLRVRARDLVEKPDPKDTPSQVSVFGRYILQPEVFGYLEGQAKGAGGEIQLTDALSAMIQDFPFHGVRFDGERYDCGNRRGFLEANIAFALARDDMREDVVAMIKRFAAAF